MGFLLDASHYQGTINWPRVRDDGCLGAYIKVTDGANGTDVTWPSNHAGARAVGLPVGPYHFSEDGNPASEAHNFAGAWPAGWDLAPTLDEEKGTATAAFITAFRSTFRAATGHQPFRVYSSLSLLEGALVPANWVDTQTTIWAARYAAVLGWNHPALVLWQNTSSATLVGVLGDVDEDQFLNGWTPAADQGGPVVLGTDDINAIVNAIMLAPITRQAVDGGPAETGQTNLSAVIAYFDANLGKLDLDLAAEQAAVLSAIQGIQSGTITDTQLATLTQALEAALPSYTVSIAPKTS